MFTHTPALNYICTATISLILTSPLFLRVIKEEFISPTAGVKSAVSMYIVCNLLSVVVAPLWARDLH